MKRFNNISQVSINKYFFLILIICVATYTLSNFFPDYFIYLLGSIVGIMLHYIGLKAYFIWGRSILLITWIAIFHITRKKIILLLLVLQIWLFLFMIDVYFYETSPSVTPKHLLYLQPILATSIKSLTLALLLQMKLNSILSRSNPGK